MRHPYRASFCIQPYSNDSKRFFVQCLAPGQNSAYMAVGLDDFHYFIAIFNNWPSRAWCIFDIQITGTEITESTKPKLRVIGCYSIRTINTIHIFSRLRLAFSPLSKKNVKYGVFSLCWCLLWCALNTESSNHKTV